MADAILHHLLAAPAHAAPIDGIDAWWAGHRAAAAPFARPSERAMAGGFAADRPAWAFASGYQEALRALIPGLGDARVALCATEEGGAHPAAIQTRLSEDGRLSGRKRYTTLGTAADELLVVASTGRDQAGRNRLAVVRIPATRAGVVVEPMPATPFVPEVPHASLRLDDVRVEPGERLPGDGYDAYLKPFRTVEDCHVHAAVLAWLVQVARRAAWPRATVEQLMARLAALHALAAAAPGAPAVHVALGGVLADSARLLADTEALWATVDADTRARWQRDRALLGVAGKARARRLEAAWERLGSTH